MDWYVYLAIGFALGFVSAILSLVVYGRKQIKAALNQFKVK